ncbi:MAG: DoxX family protein [Prevotella sp.]|jgi:putative oxidoreductase|nr:MULTISPECIES: DoxX family protein [unclassified Prevotella]MCH3969949.1 DoxX family protein [Prevotella sp.]MCH3984647.1 DoxX family protein [Prevotella sp.]MCH3991254.1 DoxX family protein [Prevotella sp.]MCH4186354.1 DoxX family protein [Prevotella sp.]MCH4215798.1 DoxX family protein [Prevotella sp.]
MKLIYYLFPGKRKDAQTSSLLLATRVIFGLLLASHGLQKLINFSTMASQFPDPLDIGGKASLSLAIFGELACSIAFIAGFLTRLAVIPMIFTMSVAFFTVHNGSISAGELAFAYLMVFLLMFFAGPGNYSIDSLIGRKLSCKGV